ncbi:hypothetical protein HNP11_004209 [Tsukamurella ocularis]|uniref:hypothetical protein n=1 Tax=Tsukamurella ocularis TaxID=1970234 RepID=UPI002168A638|nr:hypothetical protein [Tsukamurella ocularis]MCS3790010.1 hypothetical protein [Tsukamurella ocularis]
MATMLGNESKLAMIPKWIFASIAAWIIVIALAARQRPLELAERLGGKVTQVGTAVDRVQALLANRDLTWLIAAAACGLGIVAFYGMVARYGETESVEDAATDVRCSTALWGGAVVALTAGGFWMLVAFFGFPVLEGVVVWRFSLDAGWLGLVPASFIYAVPQPIFKLLEFFGLVRN